MLSKRRLILLACLLLLTVVPAFARTNAEDTTSRILQGQAPDSWSARVVRVQDGDSVIVQRSETKQRLRLRLYGIDAPELAQRGGKRAHQALQRLLPKGARVSVQVMDQDRHQRLVAVVYKDTTPVNVSLLEQGQAWFLKRHCKARFCASWQRTERLAKRERRGLWADEKPLPPWVWRRQNRR